MLNARDILQHYTALTAKYAERDSRWDDNCSARMGDLARIAPDMFSDVLPKPIVANFVDTVARDLSEMLAPLPSFNCSSATMASDTARKFADRRAKILRNYVEFNQLDRQMLEGADHFFTYAVTVIYYEPDFEAKMPRICVEDPRGGYAEFTRWGTVKSYTKRFYQDAMSLANMFPEFADAILSKDAMRQLPGGTGHQVELFRYCDKDQITIVLNSKEPTVLVNTGNPLGETPVTVIRRPWLHADAYKGQLDDAVWIQVARNTLAVLNLEAVEKSVQAPTALPSDVQEFPLGPDAIIRSQSPEKVRRVGLELPTGAFQESAVLQEELRIGTRYPAARTGTMQGSIVTGRGVESLLGGFESQIQAAQVAFKVGFTDMSRILFKMDETYWGSVKKDIRGSANGTPYEFSYRPSKDIAGDHWASIEYGFASGMDPNRAVVMLLQLRGDKLISRDYFQRQLPFDINVTEEAAKVDVEDIREAIKQGMFGYVQAIPALIQQGIDPSDPVLKAAMLVKGIQDGETIENVVLSVFTPQQPAASPDQGPNPAQGGPPGMAGPGGGGAGGPGGGLTDSGRLVGVPPGQAGQAPGGRPDLSVMLAGLTGQGQPQMSAYTMRRRRI